MQFRFPVAMAALFFSFLPLTNAQVVNWHDAEAVVRSGLDRHPALTSIDALVDAAEERTRVAGARPNPMIMGGVQNQQIDLTIDEMMTMYMVGASQSLPRRSRRKSLERAAELEVEQLRLEARSVREELRRDLLSTYYDLAAADSQLAATRQLTAIADSIVATARFRYETGTTIQADVIRAQLQRSEIDHQLLTLGSRRRIAASRLLAQLGFPLATGIPTLHLSHSTAKAKIETDPAVPPDHPALAAVTNEVEQREQDIVLAKLIARPDWTVEASYAIRPLEKDMFNILARVELPIRKASVIEPQIRAAVAGRDAATQRLDAVRRRLQEELGAAFAQHDEATKQLSLHQEVLVPQSKLAFDSTLAAYQSGKDNFESVLIAETLWLRLEIDYYDLLAQHIKAIINFDALLRGARSGASGSMSSSAGPAPAKPLGNGMSGMR